jgi:hypothetical protein
VPRAAEDFTLAAVGVLARRLGDDEAGDAPRAERPALMRATVAQREELPADIENTDRPPGDRDNLVRAGRNLLDGGDDVFDGPNPRGVRSSEFEVRRSERFVPSSNLELRTPNYVSRYSRFALPAMIACSMSGAMRAGIAWSGASKSQCG